MLRIAVGRRATPRRATWPQVPSTLVGQERIHATVRSRTGHLHLLMHILLRLGETSNGQPSFEPVHAISLSSNRYTLESTPGLAYGVAAGDEIELADSGEYKVVARAGNLAIRVFSSRPFDGCQNQLNSAVKALGGRLDGSVERGLAYTIPIGVGFSAIERVFNEFVLAQPDCEWEFGNVYAEDGSQIGWWETAI